VSPALEHVDSSSGSIGTAVNHAIEELVTIIAKTPVDLGRRARWLERLWDAYVADAVPYIETLGEWCLRACTLSSAAAAAPCTFKFRNGSGRATFPDQSLAIVLL
jgi:hypothetical protein